MMTFLKLTVTKAKLCSIVFQLVERRLSDDHLEGQIEAQNAVSAAASRQLEGGYADRRRYFQ